jgi:hypothetical protein
VRGHCFIIMRGIRISTRANIHHFDIPVQMKSISQVLPEHISFISNDVGDGQPAPECEWDLTDGTSVVVWGWVNGTKGQNRFDMPPMDPANHLNERFWGDIVLLGFRTTSGNLVDMTMDRFNAWYDEAMGGFESLGEEDTDGDTDIDTDDEGLGSFIDDRPEDELSTHSDSLLDNSDSLTDSDE